MTSKTTDRLESGLPASIWLTTALASGAIFSNSSTVLFCRSPVRGSGGAGSTCGRRPTAGSRQ